MLVRVFSKEPMGYTWADVLVLCGLAPSKREARTLCKGGAILKEIEGRPVKKWQKIINADDPFEETGTFMFSRGKQWGVGHLVRVEMVEDLPPWRSTSIPSIPSSLPPNRAYMGQES